MTVVTIHKAKAHLSRLIAKASESEEGIIARGAKPVARLDPVGEVKGKRRPGSSKGIWQVGRDFFGPLPLTNSPSGRGRRAFAA